MPTPESKIKATLDKALKEIKGVWFFSPQAGPFGRAGIPDRLVCANGEFIGIECKADNTKKPTRLQKDCMRKIELAGGKCFLVYDHQTIEEAIEYIKDAAHGRTSQN